MEKDIFIKPNDIIIFDDRHKLFCGDCTKIESYNFMENEIATITRRNAKKRMEACKKR